MKHSCLKLVLFLLLLIPGIGKISAQESHFQDLSVEEFFKKVNIKDTSVFVYFNADWCVPCVKLKPVIKELEKEYQGKIKFLILDVDKNPQVSLHFEINTLPYFSIYKNSKEVWHKNIFISKEKLAAALNQYK